MMIARSTRDRQLYSLIVIEIDGQISCFNLSSSLTLSLSLSYGQNNDKQTIKQLFIKPHPHETLITLHCEFQAGQQVLHTMGVSLKPPEFCIHSGEHVITNRVGTGPDRCGKGDCGLVEGGVGKRLL